MSFVEATIPGVIGFIATLWPQVFFVGSNATFNVVATGTGLTYQWFFNGALVSTNSVLTLGNLSTNQAGTYCVVVSDVCGSPATNCTTLTIQNRAPVANNDAYSVNEDTTLNISVPGVLSNDGDIDGDRCILHYLGDRQPSAIELDLPAGSPFHFDLIDTRAMTITPLAEYSGPSRIPLPATPYLALRGTR